LPNEDPQTDEITVKISDLRYGESLRLLPEDLDHARPTKEEQDATPRVTSAST
jgi:hypothetical protein